MKIGQIFYSKWLIDQKTKESIPIEVKGIDEENDLVIVDWNSGAGYDSWVLSHCQTAFKIGEYSNKPFK